MAEGLVRRRLIVSAIAIVAIGAIGYGAFKRLGTRPARPEQAESVARLIAVHTTPLSRRDFPETLTGYGRARALRRTEVSAEVAGIVKDVWKGLESGADVDAETELVTLDSRDLKQAEAAAKARVTGVAAEKTRLASEVTTSEKRLAKARADLDASRRELKRIHDLQAQRAVTESDYDRQSMQTTLRETAVLELEGRLASLNAQLERNEAESLEAGAALSKAENDVKRTVIHAPYAARVVRRTVQPGARVAPGTVLFELVDTARVEIAVALPASRYGEIAVGAAAKVRPAAGRTNGFDSKVVRIAPEVDPSDRTFFAYLLVEDGSVAPGAFVVAEISGRKFRDVFVLPRTAFVGGQVFVAVDGVARARTPKALALLPHVMLTTDGVAAGERLIVTNLEEVADGTKVSVQTQATPERDS